MPKSTHDESFPLQVWVRMVHNKHLMEIFFQLKVIFDFPIKLRSNYKYRLQKGCANPAYLIFNFHKSTRCYTLEGFMSISIKSISSRLFPSLYVLLSRIAFFNLDWNEINTLECFQLVFSWFSAFSCKSQHSSWISQRIEKRRRKGEWK